MKKRVVWIGLLWIMIMIGGCGKEVPSEVKEETNQNDESKGDIVVLYTSDVHCGIEENIG